MRQFGPAHSSEGRIQVPDVLSQSAFGTVQWQNSYDRHYRSQSGNLVNTSPNSLSFGMGFMYLGQANEAREAVDKFIAKLLNPLYRPLS